MTTLATARVSQKPATEHSVQDDLMRWAMLRTRRRHRPMHRGMDAVANRWLARLRHVRLGLGHLQAQAQAVVALADGYRDLKDMALDERIAEIRSVFACHRQQPDDLRQALAAVREVARRTTGEYPYPVQLMGAMGLYHGQIVEMVTGEGKTLTASVAAVLLAWSGRPVHVFTVNDYLATRDAEGRQPIFQRCGLKAAALTGEMKPDARRLAYRHPVLYTTAREVMADWLRDQLLLGRQISPVATRWRQSPLWQDGGDGQGGAAPQTLVPGLFIALVDEIDAILIDEAVTPLIIAQRDETNRQETLYRRAAQEALALQRGRDYELKVVRRQAKLTDTGRKAVARSLGADPALAGDPLWKAARLREEMVEQALVARHCYHAGRHYQVIDGKVMIVDEYTGRFMTDRHWQHGLHQAVEAKHELEISGEQRTLASISFQRFFRQYEHLCGMTGTAAEARPEMERTYGLPVRVIPTHRPIARRAWPTLCFADQPAKWQAVLREVQQVHASHRPVLIGTRSVEASQHVSELLNGAGLAHQVLNAIEHEQEAMIVSRAGQPDMITVATNMAGRGTDIKLGAGVAELGGLHVILTEKHNARRVDRQFIGRCGRQGDPGSSRIFLSLTDELIVQWFAVGARSMQWLTRLRARERPLRAWLGGLFSFAQRRATTHAARARISAIGHDHELDRSLPS